MALLKRIDAAMLSALSAEAATASRRRKNLNVHESLDDPVQRLLNAFEPGTYVRPHRHTEPPKWELFALISGRAAVLTFDDAGRVSERAELDAAHRVRVVEIPAGTWHTLVALEAQTVLLEVKAGPYVPATPADLAPWAPAEGTPEAARLEIRFRTAGTGDLLAG